MKNDNDQACNCCPLALHCQVCRLDNSVVMLLETNESQTIFPTTTVQVLQLHDYNLSTIDSTVSVHIYIPDINEQSNQSMNIGLAEWQAMSNERPIMF